MALAYSDACEVLCKAPGDSCTCAYGDACYATCVQEYEDNPQCAALFDELFLCAIRLADLCAGDGLYEETACAGELAALSDCVGYSMTIFKPLCS